MSYFVWQNCSSLVCFSNKFMTGILVIRSAVYFPQHTYTPHAETTTLTIDQSTEKLLARMHSKHQHSIAQANSSSPSLLFWVPVPSSWSLCGSMPHLLSPLSDSKAQLLAAGVVDLLLAALQPDLLPDSASAVISFSDCTQNKYSLKFSGIHTTTISKIVYKNTPQNKIKSCHNFWPVQFLSEIHYALPVTKFVLLWLAVIWSCWNSYLNFQNNHTSVLCHRSQTSVS